MSAAEPTSAELQRAIQRQHTRILALRSTLYSQVDPSGDQGLEIRLADAEKTLAELEIRARECQAAEHARASVVSAPKGRLLGAKTTGLRIEPTLLMQPVPTGIYHLLDPEIDPLLRVVVGNESRDTRRVCVKVFVEGLSAESVRTIEVEPRGQVTLNFLPTLHPERSLAITQIQRATLHILVEDLDGKPESHDTKPLILLARTSSFNSTRNPETGEAVDLTHYYGAWVTPHAEAVRARVRRAAELLPDRRIWGYQGDPDVVDRQVEAMFTALKEVDICYINSVIDYGAPAGLATQRTRLPRESLAERAANCIDGAVLLASLLEGASLSAALVLVPGHAFVGWETWDGSGEWKYLETTMIGSHGFAEAVDSGTRQFEQANKYGRAGLKVHQLADLRARSIWPME